ncbi:MAG: BON domain-containing protein [Acidobacteriota bacterium]
MVNPKMRIAALTVCIALTLGGCSLFKSSTAPNDSAIVSAIQSKLYQDPALKTSDVRVVSQNGVVVLTGTVASDQDKAAVEQFAKNTDGVKQVIDELTTTGSAQEADSTGQGAPPPDYGTSRRRSRTLAEREPAPEEPTPAPEAAPTPAPVEQVPPASAQAPEAPPPPPQPASVAIPAGTVITVRMVDSIDSAVNKAGDEFAATVETPITEENQIIIPRYSKARLRLVSDRNAGRIKGRSEVQLQLISLTVGGKTYAVSSGVYQKQAAKSRGKQTATRAGIGAALGGVIGAIAGGGKGAAIGAGVGAGAGTGVQMATKGQPVRIPSETEINFTLRSPLNITVYQ